jgi:hypothetical protein
MMDEKQAPAPSTVRGPYVGTAVFCEKVLREADGVLSLIRIVDRILFQVPSNSTTQGVPPPIILFLAIMLKAGDLQGSYNIAIESITPSNHRLGTIQAPVLFEGNDRGVTVVLQLPFQPLEDGVYWFDVSLEGIGPLTRVPLRAIFQKLSMTGQA